MTARKKTYGFGYDPQETQNHFFVVVPKKGEKNALGGDVQVQVYERFAWTVPMETAKPEDEDAPAAEAVWPEGVQYKDHQVLAASDVLRIEISPYKWKLLVNDIMGEFNARLRDQGITVGKFPAGGTPVERMMGKELMVLLWVVADTDPSNIPKAIMNWKGLQPEERWWLYTMTNASTGGIGDKLGWRTALQYALCYNPLPEQQQTCMEMLVPDANRIMEKLEREAREARSDLILLQREMMRHRGDNEDENAEVPEKEKKTAEKIDRALMAINRMLGTDGE